MKLSIIIIRAPAPQHEQEQQKSSISIIVDVLVLIPKTTQQYLQYILLTTSIRWCRCRSIRLISWHESYIEQSGSARISHTRHWHWQLSAYSQSLSTGWVSTITCHHQFHKLRLEHPKCGLTQCGQSHVLPRTDHHNHNPPWLYIIVIVIVIDYRL